MNIKLYNQCSSISSLVIYYINFILEIDKLKVCCVVIVNVIRIDDSERLTIK